MNETSASLRYKIKGAGDLQSIVRTMTSPAASTRSCSMSSPGSRHSPDRGGQRKRDGPFLNRSKATMLITFETKAYASITMFGDVAIALLKLMGHSAGVPGALMADDVPAALTRLKAAVQRQPDEPTDPTDGPASDEEDDAHVSLAHRALPLIELLTAAAAAHENVMWDG
jgi:hypothetical protein